MRTVSPLATSIDFTSPSITPPLTLMRVTGGSAAPRAGSRSRCRCRAVGRGLRLAPARGRRRVVVVTRLGDHERHDGDDPERQPRARFVDSWTRRRRSMPIPFRVTGMSRDCRSRPMLHGRCHTPTFTSICSLESMTVRRTWTPASSWPARRWQRARARWWSRLTCAPTSASPTPSRSMPACSSCASGSRRRAYRWSSAAAAARPRAGGPAAPERAGAAGAGPSGARWVLVETPFHGIRDDFHDATAELRERGFGVLVAHPERSADASLDGAAGLRGPSWPPGRAPSSTRIADRRPRRGGMHRRVGADRGRA